MGFYPNLKPPTPEEASVIFWFFVVATGAIGIAAFYFSMHAHVAEKAAQLRAIGAISLGIAAAIWIGRKVVAKFFD